MLNKYIKELKELRTEEKLKISDEVLFENAIKIYISDNIGKSKLSSFANKEHLVKKGGVSVSQTFKRQSNQGTPPYIPSKKTLEKWASEKASEKQLAVLKKIGVENLDQVTKLDAYHILNNNKKKNL